MDGPSPTEKNAGQYCLPEIYDSKKIPWEEISDSVVNIENTQFGEEAFTEDELKEGMTSENNTIILLRDSRTNEVIGYTYAFPLLEEAEEDIHKIEREDRGEKTAYVENTALHPKYMGNKLVGSMLELLEQELVRKGYLYMERDAATANNYAENIAKNYGDRIIYKGDPHESQWGEQVFFRIKLGSS